jgi:hypothetical protein
MNAKLITWIIPLAALAISTQLQGQSEFGSIKGKVSDKSTKQGIIGASVFINGTQIGTTTDTVGIFNLTNIPEGNYVLRISFIGYKERIIADVYVTRNKTFYAEIELLDAPIQLNEVALVVHRYENDPKMPVSSYSFSREEIFRNPGAQGDIFRAIGILPGVTSSGGQYSAIAVRGQGTKDNVFMVDDIPMVEVSHLEGNGGFNDPNGGRFSIFAPRVVDNAVFQGGGFSAQYGRKASSYLGLGIKEGNRESSFISGQFDLLGATLIYDGPSYFDKKTSLFATARYQNFRPVIKLLGLDDLGTASYADYMIKSSTELNMKNKLSVLAMYNPESAQRTVDNAKFIKKIDNTAIYEGHHYKALFGLNLRTLISKTSYWKNILYYRMYSINAKRGFIYPEADVDGNVLNRNDVRFEDDLIRFEKKNHETGYRSIFTKDFKTSTLTAGIDFARIDLNNTRSLKHMDTIYVYNRAEILQDPAKKYLILPPEFYDAAFKKFTYNGSAYVDYSFLVFDKVTINSGLRYDHTGFTSENLFSPRLSVNFQLTEKTNFSFASGIFYQDPDYGDIADQPSEIKLKSERTLQVITGFKKYLTPDTKFIIEGWYKQFTNLVTRPISSQKFLTNNGTGWASGIDVNLTKRLSINYYGQVGYSYMQSKRDNHDNLGEYNFAFSQPHIISFLGSYKPNAKWIFSAKFRYSTGRPKNKYTIHNNVFNDSNHQRSSQEITSVNGDRLSDFISLDIRADYRVQISSISFTAFIDIVNALNRQTQNAELFQPITGSTYYDGSAIFPSFGIRIEK